MNTFNSVKSKKVSELIVQQIKSAILGGTIKPGDKLPTEQELVRQFQASRISVREGLQKLEAAGLVTIKHGSGVFVSEVSSRLMSESLFSILRIQRTSINDLTEARIILEPATARLASERITKEELIKLERNIQEASAIIKSNSPALAQNIEFHSIIAEATHNSVITLTVRAMLDVLREISLETMDNLTKRVRDSKNAIEFHKRILKALRGKNSQQVYELLLKHILQIQGGLKNIKSKNRK